MSFIPMIDSNDTTPEVTRYLDAGVKQYGVLLNNWKMIGNSMRILRPFTQFVGAVLNPESLSKRTLELAILKTSLLNYCRY